VLRLAEPRVVLTTTAWMELRAHLANAARSGADVDEPLVTALHSTARLADNDASLTASFETLSRCETHACVARSDPDLANALVWFEPNRWRPRATASWAGIEAADAVLTTPVGEALLLRAANDLGVAFREPVTVGVVSEAPSIRDRDLVPPVLAARGSCFAKGVGRDPDRAVADARILDCVLVHVLLGADGGPVARALGDRLGAQEGRRAYTLLVVHVVASLVRSYEPRHGSVYLRSVRAVEPARMDWLAKEWIERREPPETFAHRFAASYE
jgi:hypothetical protein